MSRSASSSTRASVGFASSGSQIERTFQAAQWPRQFGPVPIAVLRFKQRKRPLERRGARLGQPQGFLKWLPASFRRPAAISSRAMNRWTAIRTSGCRGSVASENASSAFRRARRASPFGVGIWPRGACPRPGPAPHQTTRASDRETPATRARIRDRWRPETGTRPAAWQ